MKKFILITALLFSTAAQAEQYQIYPVNQFVRIVLSQRECMIPDMTGKAAALQTIRGRFIRGCWNIDKHNDQHIRIDWANPQAPGDFAVIESNKLISVDE